MSPITPANSGDLRMRVSRVDDWVATAVQSVVGTGLSTTSVMLRCLSRSEGIAEGRIDSSPKRLMSNRSRCLLLARNCEIASNPSGVPPITGLCE